MAGLARRLGWCVAGYAALAWLPLVASEYHTHVLTIALYYVIVAVGWNLLAGYAGQFSLAQHTFAGIGAYGSALLCLYAGVPILVGIVELVSDKATKAAGGYLDDLGPRLTQAFLDRNILLRPLGNVLYFMPPYVLTDDEFALLVERTVEIVDAA